MSNANGQQYKRVSFNGDFWLVNRPLLRSTRDGPQWLMCS
jgi:hypothetical protein